MSERIPEDIRLLINELDRQIDYIGTQNRLSARITELEAALEHAERALTQMRADWEMYLSEPHDVFTSLRTRLAEAEAEVTRLRDVEGLAWQTKVLKAEQRGRQLEDVLRSLNLMCVRGWNAQDMHDVIDAALRTK